MSRRHIFAIFKLPRTGSTRLAQLINEHPECYCRKEILNRPDGAQSSQSCIDDILGRRNKRNIGFTLNPEKRRRPVEPDFFDHRRRFANRELVVFSLTRKNVLHHALSVFVCRQIGLTPGSRNSANADEAARFIARGIEVPLETWEPLWASMVKAREACVDIARRFAERSDAPFIQLAYEGIYDGERPDLARLFNALGVTDGIPVPDSNEKLLPSPETYVTNYADIAALARLP